MAEPFFSIVMPVYKAAEYLETAVDSIRNQSYTNWEAILVDDCSPDESGAIADRLAAKDGRIRVVHKPQNQGASEARNTGMDQVAGTYLMFMDADDRIDSDLFEQAAASLKENPAQVVVFGLVEEYYDKSGQLHHQIPVGYAKKLFSRQADLRREIIYLEKSTLYGYACNKFYATDYLRTIHIRYPVSPLLEDFQFNVEYFMDVESLNILDGTPYHYNKRLEGSLTSRYVPEYFTLHCKKVAMLYEQHTAWGICTEEVRRILADIFVRYIFSALQRNCDKRSGMGYRDRKAFLIELYHDPLFTELIPYAGSGGRLIRWMGNCLKKRWTALCLAGGRAIFVIKTGFPMLFARAKQSR